MARTRLTFASKLSIVLAISLVTSLLIGLVAYSRVAAISSRFDEVASSQFPAALALGDRAKLQEIFLKMHEDPKGKKILGELFIDKFIVPQDRDYDSVREMEAWIASQQG